MKLSYYLPENVSADDIRKVRKNTGLSQKEFADLLRVSKSTIERWEAGSDRISGPVVMLSYLLKLRPELTDLIRLPEMTTSLRLYYFHDKTLCTLIDVDEIRQHITIRNYVENIFFCAFGSLNQPSYSDYQAFLKSRCFPEERDMVQLELQELGLPFYDPMMIIEKTEGRMAEDHFWIKIERNYDRII